MVDIARAVAAAENYRKGSEKRETARSDTQKCSHVSPRRRRDPLGAQHFGETSEALCELRARVATVEMVCESRLLEF